MADHIIDIHNCNISKVDKSGFYAAIQPGDLVFCSGSAPVSIGIKVLTRSPWTHVLKAWIRTSTSEWYTAEATIDHGVHIGRLSEYVDCYPGPLCIARRFYPNGNPLTLADHDLELNAIMALLDDEYDWRQEVSVVARKLVRFLPLIQPQKEFYCSALIYAGSLAGPVHLAHPDKNMPSPEENWCDPSVRAVALFLK